MKKNYLSILLVFAFVCVTNAQTFEFNNSTENFTPTGAASVTTNPTTITYAVTTGRTSFYADQKTSANGGTLINATNANYLKLVIKNTSQFTNFSCRTTTGTLYGAAITITKGDTEFKTYYYPLNTANWTGTIDGFRVQIGAGTAVAGDAIEIDQISFFKSTSTTTYNNFVQNPGFDDSVISYDGWKVPTNRTATTFSLSTTEHTTGTQSLKVNYVTNTVAGSEFIFIENLNTGTFTTPYDDTAMLKASMKVKLKRTGAGAGINKVVNAQTNFRINGTTNIPTASIDNSGALDAWELMEFQVGVPTGTSLSSIIYRINFTGIDFLAGDEIYIDDVQTCINCASLRTNAFSKDDASIKIYPNPVKDILNISTDKTIQKISVIDLLGRTVLTPKVSTEINLSSLEKGTYLLSLESENGISTKKFIKN